jgi:hypothetical protein
MLTCPQRKALPKLGIMSMTEVKAVIKRIKTEGAGLQIALYTYIREVFG